MLKSAWTIEPVRHRLATDSGFVAWALEVLFQRQTASERAGRRTSVLNGQGFNRADSYILSSLARHFQGRGYLTPDQLAVARRRLRKYAGQLSRVAETVRPLMLPR